MARQRQSTTTYGEKGFSTLERVWARPTAEINGIWGGYTGAGHKTIVPSEAHAKLSFRLVAGPGPARHPGEVPRLARPQRARGHRVVDRVLRRRGAAVPDPARPSRAGAVTRAMETAFGSEVLYTREGGSGPEAELQDVLAAPVVFLGVSLPDDGWHAPNEKVEIPMLLKGAEAAAHLWDELAADVAPVTGRDRLLDLALARAAVDRAVGPSHRRCLALGGVELAGRAGRAHVPGDRGRGAGDPPALALDVVPDVVPNVGSSLACAATARSSRRARRERRRRVLPQPARGRTVARRTRRRTRRQRGGTRELACDAHSLPAVRCRHEGRSGGHTRVCEVDGSEHYPRTDPAVIMAVVDADDRLLLGRQAAWPEGRFSTLAGFVEPGESLEQAVRREVREEVGVEIGDVDYLGSQPWPFPSSLMLGFVAHAKTVEISGGDGEIAEARWFTREACATT